MRKKGKPCGGHFEIVGRLESMTFTFMGCCMLASPCYHLDVAKPDVAKLVMQLSCPQTVEQW